MKVLAVKVQGRGKSMDEHATNYVADLKAKLILGGYKGPLTGEVVKFRHADSHAQYMVADSPTEMVLVHLPVWDAWSLPEWQTRGLRRSDVVALVNQQKAWDELIASARRNKETSNVDD